MKVWLITDAYIAQIKADTDAWREKDKNIESNPITRHRSLTIRLAERCMEILTNNRNGYKAKPTP